MKKLFLLLSVMPALHASDLGLGGTEGDRKSRASETPAEAEMEIGGLKTTMLGHMQRAMAYPRDHDNTLSQATVWRVQGTSIQGLGTIEAVPSLTLTDCEHLKQGNYRYYPYVGFEPKTRSNPKQWAAVFIGSRDNTAIELLRRASHWGMLTEALGLGVEATVDEITLLNSKGDKLNIQGASDKPKKKLAKDDTLAPPVEIDGIKENMLFHVAGGVCGISETIARMIVYRVHDTTHEKLGQLRYKPSLNLKDLEGIESGNYVYMPYFLTSELSKNEREGSRYYDHTDAGLSHPGLLIGTTDERRGRDIQDAEWMKSIKGVVEENNDNFDFTSGLKKKASG